MIKKIIYVLFLIPFCLSAQNKVDSLFSSLKTTKADTDRINILNKLSWDLSGTNPDTAMLLSNEALLFSQKIKSKKHIANSLYQIAWANYMQGKYPESIENNLKALSLREELNDQAGIATSLGNIGVVYANQGNYPKALDCYFEALKINQTLNDKNGITINSGNIGSVFLKQGNHSRALHYYTLALKITEELGNKKIIAVWLGNIGNVYGEQGNNEKSILKKDSLFNKALEYYLNALKMNEELGRKSGVAIQLGNIGELYTKTKKYTEAEKYLLDALKLDKEIGSKDNEMEVEQSLSELYSKTNRYQLAFEHYRKTTTLKDSLFNAESSEKITSMQFKYEQEKKDKIRELEEKLKEEQHNAEIKQQKIILWSVIAGLLLVAVFSVFMFNRWRVTQKQKAVIEQQKHEVDEQKKLVEEKSKDITDSIHAAKRIQQALLTSRKEIGIALSRKFLPSAEEKIADDKFFILFKPKDIVSGDFYWSHVSRRLSKTDGGLHEFFFACCDCTGHGVPGAFMSLLNISFLNEAVLEKQLYDPSKILDYVRLNLIKSLNQGTNTETKEGMDAVLFKIDFNSNMLYASCANNSLIIKRNNELVEMEPDKMPVGIHDNMHKPFAQHTYQLLENDTIYAYTDGFADQFGGPKGKKFKYKQLNDLLLANSNKPMNEQRDVLEKTFEDWRGDLEQVDDVLVIGIRI